MSRGNYTFAGTKPKNQNPFLEINQGNVSYQGDDYQRKMRVASSFEMAMNDPGSKLFMEIDNPFGDYKRAARAWTRFWITWTCDELSWRWVNV